MCELVLSLLWASETVFHAFLSSLLDYCNALLFCAANGLMHRLQLAQNATAWLVTGTRCCDRIKLTLRQLHWLLVRQWVSFKITILDFHCLNGQAPPYWEDNCQLASDVCLCRLHWSNSVSCIVQHTHNSCGDRCFVAARPWVWNSLPAELWQYDSLRLVSGTKALCDIVIKQCRIEIVLLT